MSDTFCRDCNSLTEVVFDHRAGDAICSECGLVLEAHTVDETAEWRSFADDSNDSDPNRVGGPVNPLLSEAGLSTVITTPRNGGSSFSVGKWQGRGSKPDRHLLDVFGAIAVMADRLGLVTTIKDRANEIYKKVEDQKPLRGRHQDAIVAACLYIACRQENKARTMKEICTAVSGATKKEIGRAKEFILKHLEAELGQEMGTIHAGDYLRRFCSNLGMKNRDVKAAQEMVQNIEELVIRRSPISVAAAVIFTINQLSDDLGKKKKLSDEKMSLKEISVATQVAEGTIKNSYKDLYPHLARIIPTWFANEECVKNLQP